MFGGYAVSRCSPDVFLESWKLCETRRTSYFCWLSRYTQPVMLLGRIFDHFAENITELHLQQDEQSEITTIITYMVHTSVHKYGEYYNGVHTYIRTYIPQNIRRYACTYTHTNIICMLVHTYIHTNVLHLYVRMYVCNMNSAHQTKS